MNTNIDSKTTPNTSKFYRITAVLFIGFLAGIILCSFQKSAAPFEITTGVITLIILMLIVILSEIFSSISFGTFLHLRREVQRAEQEKIETKQENKELRSSLVSLATSFNQSQVTNHFTGIDAGLLKRALGVVDASPEEKQAEKEEAPIPQPETPSTIGLEEEDWEYQKRYRSLIEEDLIRKFSEKYAIPQIDIRREVKFGTGLEALDPIMSRDVIYDAYVKTGQKEYFIEVAPTGSISLMYRLYASLARILFYRQAKRVEAELVLIFPIMPENERIIRKPSSKLVDWFQPALSNNLLRFETFEYTEGESTKFRDLAKK